MKKEQKIIAVFTFGILWGISEIILGDLTQSFYLPVRGMFISTLAIFFIIVTKKISDFIGAIILLGAFSVLLKAIYYSTIKHSALYAVLLESIIAEIVFFLIKDFRKASVLNGGLILLYTFFHGIIMHGASCGRNIFSSYKNILYSFFGLDITMKISMEITLFVAAIIHLIFGLFVGIISYKITLKIFQGLLKEFFSQE